MQPRYQSTVNVMLLGLLGLVPIDYRASKELLARVVAAVRSVKGQTCTLPGRAGAVRSAPTSTGVDHHHRGVVLRRAGAECVGL